MKATALPPPPGKFRYFRVCPVSPMMIKILAVEFWKKLESGKMMSSGGYCRQTAFLFIIVH